MAVKKGFLEKVIDLFKEGFFEQWIFVLIFYDRVIRYVVLGLFIEQTAVVEHYYYAIEKYSYLVIFAFLLIRCVYLLFADRKSLLKSGTLFLAAFCGVVLLSTFINNADFMYDYMKKLSVSELLMVALCFYNFPRFMSRKRFDATILWCGRLICYIVLILGILSLYIYYTEHSVSLFGTVFEKTALYSQGHAGDYTFRYHGLFHYPTTLGFRCYLATVLSCHLCKKGKMNIIMPILLIPISCILIYLADTRSGMINMLVIFLFIIANIMQRFSVRAKKAYGIVAIVILIAAIIIAFTKRNTLLELLSDPLGTLNLLSSSRVEMFVDRWKIFMAHPWIGAGWEVEAHGGPNAHNLLANILAWTGLAGLITFSGFVIFSIYNVVKRKRLLLNNQYLFCLVVCVIIQSLLDQAIIGDMRNPATYLFWICFGFFSYGSVDDSGLMSNTNSL